MEVGEEEQGYLGSRSRTSTLHGKALWNARGVYVYKITEDSAAANSELKEKDIITKVDGQSVRNMTDLQELLACYEMGEQIDLTVQTQKDGEYRKGQ